jgi:L-fuculose-phosphate aldolase
LRVGEVRAAVATAALRLLEGGLVRGTSGNVSARAGDLVAVTPTGVDYRTLRPADVALVDRDGGQVDGELAPSSELPLHLAVYRARDDVEAVVHTHSTFATTFAVLREEVPAVHYLLAFAGRRVRVAPYATYGTGALADACVAALGGDGAVLLANHGVVAVGHDLDRAMLVADAVEQVAELCWRARCVGTPVVLADAEMDRVADAFATYGRRPTARRPNGSGNR